MNSKQVIKSLLERYRSNQLRIVEIDKELYRLETVDNLGNSDFEEKISAGNINTLDNTIIEKEKEEGRLLRERMLCVDEISTVEFLIGNLSEDKRNLIMYRYFDNQQWVKVARNLNISESHCYKLRVAAFRDLERQYNWMIDFILKVLKFKNLPQLRNLS